jgi:serine-type D-Ala-D-Ala endopeptidase (penicillin-binding protein 7)
MCSDNPLAVYELSATLPSSPYKLLGPGTAEVNRKIPFCVGAFVLAGLVSIGTIPSEAATTARAKAAKSAQSATTPAATSTKKPVKKATARTTAYSAERSQSRKAKLAVARARATAREMADTVLPRYKVDASGGLVPDVRAAAAIIYDPDTNEILWEENAQAQRSIASITKVMTATVFLENSPDMSQPVTIARSDVFQASTTHLHANDKVTTDDLLHLLLIASDNAAARALARVSPQGSEGFIRRMNEKASELGLETTHYADPSGLLSENVSSAYDMARLITHASQDERISSIMRTNEYTVYSGKRPITFRSTNHLLRGGDVDVRAGKTGFISKAGYCLATVLRLPQSTHNVAVVVFGARSNAGRFMESRNLFNWATAKASTLFAAKPTTPQPQQ